LTWLEIVYIRLHGVSYKAPLVFLSQLTQMNRSKVATDGTMQ